MSDLELDFLEKLLRKFQVETMPKSCPDDVVTCKACKYNDICKAFNMVFMELDFKKSLYSEEL